MSGLEGRDRMKRRHCEVASLHLSGVEVFLGCQESSVPSGHLRQASCPVDLLFPLEVDP